MKLLRRNLFKLPIGIRSKMLILFSIVIILPLSFMTYFAMYNYERKIELNSITYSNQVVGNLVVNLDNYISEIRDISSMIMYNHYIQNFIIAQKRVLENKFRNVNAENPSYQDFQMSLEILNSIITSRQDISSVFVFIGNQIGMFKSSNVNVDVDYNFYSQNWFKEALIQDGKAVVTGPHLQSYLTRSPQTVFSTSRTIQSFEGFNNDVVLLLDTNMSIINNYCNAAKMSNEGFILVTDNEGKLVYYSVDKQKSDALQLDKDLLLKNILPVFEKNSQGAFITEISGEDYQLVYKRMSHSNWTVAAITPYKSMMADANNIRNILVITGLICLALMLAITFLVSTSITKPITILKKHMDQADHGNLDIKAPVYTKDEVGMLTISFNSMLDRINLLMQQLVSEQTEKRKLELQTLQHQINPHFLYNTLDSIIWMAENNDENIVPMTEALSNLFRLTLSRGQELITLRDELEHLKNYLFIQSIRYSDKLDYVITSDEALLDVKVPKLILQPLVENCIYHGIKNKLGKGTIVITVKEIEGNMIIEIADDGIGMKMTGDNSLPSSSSRSGIGVKNVDARIKLYYGNEYGIHFNSTVGVGTTAYIRMPIVKLP